jgi:hypothetical protein
MGIGSDVGRDNDHTKNMAQGALIVAAIRSGGTFLAHCLSNHSQIYCDRAESLHHRSVWCTALKADRRHLLAALLNQSGYRVSMCKLTYVQAFKEGTWGWIIKRQPRVIWLYRENVLRQALSVYLNRQVRQAGVLKRPQHTFRDAKPITVEVEPRRFVRLARSLNVCDKEAKARLAALREVLPLTYVEVVGGENAKADRLPLATTKRVCEFLGVGYELLRCELKRVNPFPMHEMIGNWRDVRKAIKGSEFADLLEAEDE